MAADPKKTTEGEDLSMEEILQSIRKIIADEDGPAESNAAPLELNDEVDAGIGSDVLELSDIVEEPAAGVDILQEIDNAFGADEPAETPAEEPAAFEPEPFTPEMSVDEAEEPVPAPATDRLISDKTAQASSKAFQKVIQTHKATTPMPHFRNNETIEDLVLETLKPLLKEWLDQHLPSMVERIVEREISKLVE